MKPNPQKGIAILIAVVAVSAMLLIALAISDISFKEQVLAFFGRDSKTAFYAANSGIECTLFHDFGGGVDGSFKFATSTSSAVPGSLYCARQNIDLDVVSDGDSAVTSFFFNVNGYEDADSCTFVQVTKDVTAERTFTVIESRGYNNLCEEDQNPSNPVLQSDNSARNLERALRMSY